MDSFGILLLYYMATDMEGCGAAFLQSDWLIAGPYLLFTNWVQGPYQEIQAQGFSEGCLENQGLVFPGTARAPS